MSSNVLARLSFAGNIRCPWCNRHFLPKLRKRSRNLKVQIQNLQEIEWCIQKMSEKWVSPESCARLTEKPQWTLRVWTREVYGDQRHRIRAPWYMIGLGFCYFTKRVQHTAASLRVIFAQLKLWKWPFLKT